MALMDYLAIGREGDMAYRVHAAWRRARNARTRVEFLVTAAIIAVTGAALAPVLPLLAGAASPLNPSHTCNLLSSRQASTLVGGAVSTLSAGRGTCLLLYSLSQSESTVESGQLASIQVVTSTKPRSLTTVKTLLNHKKIEYVGAPKGLSLTRHFVEVHGHHAVYTIQGNLALVSDTSGGGLLPQANMSTIADGATVQIIVTGFVQPQEIAQRAMADVLSQRLTFSS